jgi:predicted nucleic acid-binding Zn ribbon protein
VHVRPKRKVEKLSETIEKLLASRGLGAKLKEYRIFGRWERAVGKVIASHARPSTLRGKKLTVVVDSSTWMQQLSLLKPEIIEKVNAEMGPNAVTSILLQLGDVHARSADVERTVERPVAPLTPEDRRKIADLAGSVSDPEGRAALQHLIEKDFLARRSRRT